MKLIVESVYLDVIGFQSKRCPGSLNIGSRYSTCSFGALKLRFESDFSYLYNAIMPALESHVLDLFND